MGKQIGSQYRETLEEAGYEVAYRVRGGHVLRNIETGQLEFWSRCEGLSDSYAGYVLEVKGRGHEFISSVNVPPNLHDSAETRRAQV